jgi:hypothetical protein
MAVHCRSLRRGYGNWERGWWGVRVSATDTASRRGCDICVPKGHCSTFWRVLNANVERSQCPSLKRKSSYSLSLLRKCKATVDHESLFVSSPGCGGGGPLSKLSILLPSSPPRSLLWRQAEQQAGVVMAVEPADRGLTVGSTLPPLLLPSSEQRLGGGGP